MSGPVAVDDVPATAASEPSPSEHTLELIPGRQAVVGTTTVRRVLPRRVRRTVSAWCFADLMGPTEVSRDEGVEIGPHPHMGLQTVTWLLAGELLHRDSLGSEQIIRPGQLNLMTAGHGVAHAEESAGSYRGELRGIQLWVAQPEGTRDGPPAFEHHSALPHVDLDGGSMKVLVGSFAGTESTARRDTDHVGVDLDVRPPGTVVPLFAGHEYGLVVLEGSVVIEGRAITPGVLAYLGWGRDELHLEAREPTRGLLLGGVPFTDEILMWWNFVARSKDEVSAARASWSTDDGRFGSVDSGLPRMDAPIPPWESPDPAT